jgi:hypothetical protein
VYNPVAMLSRRCAYLVVLAVLVATFVALYPYLGSIGQCDHGGCPYVAQSSHGTPASLASVCLSAVVVGSPALLVFAALRARRLAADDSRPTEPYLSPDPPPPRLP